MPASNGATNSGENLGVEAERQPGRDDVGHGREQEIGGKRKDDAGPDEGRLCAVECGGRNLSRSSLCVYGQGGPVRLRVFFSTPAIAGRRDGSGFGGGTQERERIEDDGALLRSVVRFAERMAEGPFDEERARHAHGFGQVPCDGYGDGGDAAALNLPGDQSDGPIAEPSSGGEEDAIDRAGAEAHPRLPVQFAW